MSKISFLVVVLCTFVVTAGSVSAQQVRLPPSIAQGQAMEPIPVTRDNPIQRQQAIAANEQRQIEIRRDTKKMAELTLELEDYLEKAGKGVMSVDAIKKAEQIEKLAKSVKSKMKQSF